MNDIEMRKTCKKIEKFWQKKWEKPQLFSLAEAALLVHLIKDKIHLCYVVCFVKHL